MTDTARLEATGWLVACMICNRQHLTEHPTLNLSLWEMDRLGWEYDDRSGPEVRGFPGLWRCDQCIALKRAAWLVGCYGCEADDTVYSKEEADEWVKDHDCRYHMDWRDVRDTYIRSPQEMEQDQRSYAVRERQALARRTAELAQQAEQDRLAQVGRQVETARSSWWRRVLLRGALGD